MGTALSEPGSGLVVVDKPAGWTSHQVVGRLRRLLGTRKVGHAGTLDPMATGVLVVGVNRATRLLGHLTLTDKSYAATIRLGESTVSDDADGETTATHSAGHLGDDAIRAAAQRFVGQIDQVPSAVSAIKVGGVRSYARVRAGEDVELAARSVTVHRFALQRLIRVDLGDREVIDLDVEVDCTSGTYIRALARDLGADLGVGGHLTRLRRTRVGPWGLVDAHRVDDATEPPPMIPIDRVARATFPSIDLSEAAATDVRHGRRIDPPGGSGVSAVFHDGVFLALVRPDGRAESVFAPA